MAGEEYGGTAGCVTWSGVRLTQERLAVLAKGRLRNRALDPEHTTEFLAELRAMATTEMAIEVISEMLSSQPVILDWQVGEALAEALLEEDHNAIWPWNGSRDLKTPQASLPGADLVGFIVDDQGPALLFGEVKTSGDSGTPPNVVYGRSGLSNQLENLATQRRLHFTLLKWLQARCKDPESREMYRAAVQRFVRSNGTDFRVIGCLMRDTQPSERDLKSRATAAAASMNFPLIAQFIAWYVPMACAKWPTLLEGEGET